MNEFYAHSDLATGYNEDIDRLRDVEYPMLKGETYLDHGGTTLYSRSLMENFLNDMLSNLFGNPHSASQSSRRSTSRIKDIRLHVLKFFNANPDEFDIIFVPNTTGGVKLIIEGFRERRDALSGGDVNNTGNGFWYGYHSESHTSLVGVREFADAGYRCFKSDIDVECWLDAKAMECSDDVVGASEKKIGLFAYPGQSNMTGRRLSLSWPRRLRSSMHAVHHDVYSLLDAAALATTAQLNFSDPSEAPDFTVISFYKIFGFPDLGAVIVKKGAGHILQQRKYFGGGTVEMVISMNDPWHSMKTESLHQQLEDGTLPFHNIIALDNALRVHQTLYQSQTKVSKHTTHLAKALYEGLTALRHENGNPICEIYKDPSSEYGDSRTQGPVIAFNIKDADGGWIRLSELDKAANQNHIHLRTGDLCNPGGIAQHLDLAPWELFRNYSAGLRCGCKNIVIDGKPSGVARVSLGAMSNMRDVKKFLSFADETYRNKHGTRRLTVSTRGPKLFVNSMLIYPIQGCSGWSIPNDATWELTTKGLMWDREWCLFHLQTKVALTQRDIPRLALLTLEIDTTIGVLKMKLHPSLSGSLDMDQELHIPLSNELSHNEHASEQTNQFRSEEVRIYDVNVKTQAYTSPIVARFFTSAFGIPCTLARLMTDNPTEGPVKKQYGDLDEYIILHTCLDSPQPAASVEASISSANGGSLGYVPRSRRHRTNQDIRGIPLKPPQVVQAEIMKANIVLAELAEIKDPQEDWQWRYLRIGHQFAEASDSNAMSEINNQSRRYHIICVDPEANPDVDRSTTSSRWEGAYAKGFFEQGAHPISKKIGQLQRDKIKVGDSFSPLRKIELEE